MLSHLYATLIHAAKINIISERNKKNAKILLVILYLHSFLSVFYAIAHKDYMGAPIQMRVWDDYVEVWNEGSLPKGLTPEALLRHHSSHPRNKNIAYTFFKAGFIESWGRGYKKIREGFEKAGLPMPKIEDVEGGVRVTFQRNNVVKTATENATDIATVNATVKLNKTQEKIMAILHVDKFATYDVIAKQLGVERTTVWRNVKKLQEIGCLRRIGGDNGGYWEVI